MSKTMTYTEFCRIKNLEQNDASSKLYEMYLKQLAQEGKSIQEMHRDGNMPGAIFD